MKVFWSWQSDHPGKIARHFVRDALEQAINDLKQEPEIEEAARDFELDHDRKGVPGSPDLAAVILEKIRGSAVFVGDVTPVGHVRDNPDKKLINSNVAVELGYALATLSDRAMLMVLNEAYGNREELPFDLKHKAGPIAYRLTPSASQDQIQIERVRLAGVLRSALREIVASSPRKETPAFTEAAAAPENPGRFFREDEALVTRGGKDYSFRIDAFVYIRIFPTAAQQPLKRVEVMEAVTGGELRVFNDRASGWSTEQNKYGVIVFERGPEEGEIDSATQVFLSREIWGLDASMLSPARGRRGIPTGRHERMIALSLSRYLAFAVNRLTVKPPLVAEVGLTNVEGYVLHVRGPEHWSAEWGPIQERHVRFRETLQTGEQGEVDRFLLRVFERIFDAAGTARPDRYNNFPSVEAGSSPRR